MNSLRGAAAAFAVVFSMAGAASAQEPIIYPSKGQSAEQQEKDKFECYSWAKQQSGFDPMKQPTGDRRDQRGARDRARPR